MIASGTRRHGPVNPGTSHIECSGEAQFEQGLREPGRYADRPDQSASRAGCVVVTNCGREHFCCFSVRARTSRRKADRRAIAQRSRLVRCGFGTCSWNMRRRHSSHSWLTSAARTAVKSAPFSRVHRSEAQTLDGRRSEGYARKRVCGSFSFGPLFSTYLTSKRFRALYRFRMETRNSGVCSQAVDL